MKTSNTERHNETDRSTWERIKNAFKKDWEQTKHDFGSDKAQDKDQELNDTLKQLFGPNSKHDYDKRRFEDMEGAFRYGQAAREEHGEDYDYKWHDELHRVLRNDYQGDWARDEPLVRYSYLRNYSYS